MSKQKIIQILAAHSEGLNAFGVDRIGLVNANGQDIYSQDSEIDLVVTLQRNRNDFYNFMSLVSFLERILGHKINLILLQPRYSYLSPHILDHTEFISSKNIPSSL